GLVAPTSTPTRRARVVTASSGFVYAVSLTGVTGTSLDTQSEALRSQLGQLRRDAGELPVAVGFGIRRAEQVRSLAPHVDGIVVGSALVEAGLTGTKELAELVGQLAAATKA